MARDPNWKPDEGPDARESMRTAASSRLRQIPGIGQVLKATDAATDTIASGLRAASRYGTRANARVPPPTAPGLVDTPELAEFSKGLHWNQPARNVPSKYDTDVINNAGVAGVINGRVISRDEAGQSAPEPEPINAADTTDYAGITSRARQGIRGATLNARNDAARLVNPASNEAEILRRAQHATGSYFNKGFTGARNAQVGALLGQLEAGNRASLAGAVQEGDAELAGAGAQFQAGLDDRNIRNEAKYGLRGAAGAGGADFGDMIDLMQLEETRRSNMTDESEKARGRLQERTDALLDYDAEKNPAGLNKTDPRHRQIANFLAMSEEDPDFVESEEGQQLGRRVYNDLLARIDKNSSLFSPRADGKPQVSGRPTGLRNFRIDEDDSVGLRNLFPDRLLNAFGYTGGSAFYRNENGDEVGAPLDDLNLSDAEKQLLMELSQRYGAEAQE